MCTIDVKADADGVTRGGWVFSVGLDILANSHTLSLCPATVSVNDLSIPRRKSAPGNAEERAAYYERAFSWAMPFA